MKSLCENKLAERRIIYSNVNDELSSKIHDIVYLYSLLFVNFLAQVSNFPIKVVLFSVKYTKLSEFELY